MKLSNISAIILNDINLVAKTKTRIVEVIYFPVVTTLIWGLFSMHTKQYSAEAGFIVLVANLFWTFSHLAQQQANLLVMEDLWSLSIKHIITSGVSEFEYIIAKLVTSTLAATVISTGLLAIANAFGAPIFENIGTITKLAGITLLGSLALAIGITGVVIAAGKEYAFLSWSTLELFVFLSAPFYNPSVFPLPLQYITKVMPFTSVFEGARMIATGIAVPSELLLRAALVAIAYALISLPIYFWCFHKARKSGVLARIAT